ncbi:GAF domain-containing protein [bacterium]|nr:GAF domain-containing protein [bacterium]
MPVSITESEKFSYVQLLTILSEIVSSGGELGSVLKSTVELIQQLLRVERCSILLLDHKAAELSVAAASGIDPELTKSIRVKVGEGIAGKVAESGEPRLSVATRRRENDRRYTTNTYISAPIHSEGKVLGVINITNKSDQSKLDKDDLEVVRAVARFLSVTIDRFSLGRQLRHVNAELTKAFESIPAGIVLTTEGGNVVMANGRARGLLGLAEESQIENLEIPELNSLGVKLREMADAAIQSAAEQRGDFEPLNEMNSPLRIHAVPITENKVPTREALLIVIDMSLTREVEELRRIDEMKNNFIAVVSHELRTPLTSIRGAANLLATHYSGNFDDTQRNLLKIVTNNIERLATVVNTILDIALLDNHKLELQFEPTNIETLIEKVLQERQRSLDEQELMVSWVDQQALPNTLVDVERMTQAIEAIIDNAIKFSPRQETITITTHYNGETVEVTVQDNGEGIAPEYHDLVFEKFFQIENPLTRRKGGTGLGLYLARQIVELHRGHLTVDDSDHGALLRLALPARG